MSGVSTASDVWSVACTVVELLTGVPPCALPIPSFHIQMSNPRSYFHSHPDFQYSPMTALYRIVDDELPPLPPSLSPLLTDFLTSCFSKAPRARPTARELLAHPWITFCGEAQLRASARTLRPGAWAHHTFS